VTKTEHVPGVDNRNLKYRITENNILVEVQSLTSLSSLQQLTKFSFLATVCLKIITSRDGSRLLQSRWLSRKVLYFTLHVKTCVMC